MNRHTFPWTKYLLMVVAVAFSTLIAAQNDPSDMKDPDYPKEWAEIDSLDQRQLFRSALEKVKALQQQAQREGKNLQVIKTLVFEAKYLSGLSEGGTLKAIALFDSVIAVSSLPEKAILESTQAGLYTSYLNQNFWQINQRTQVEDEDDQSIANWSVDQFQRRIFDLYQQSISYPELKDYSSKDFALILEKGDKWTVGLRPSLLDILGHQMIDYFHSSRNYLTEPVYAYVVQDPALFGPVDQFVGLNIDSQDELSKKRKALKVFQQLSAHQLESNNIPALIDLDLKRLAYVSDN